MSSILKLVSFVVGVVRDTYCPRCGSPWQLTFAGHEVNTIGVHVVVGRAFCPRCGVELTVEKECFGVGSSVYSRPGARGAF